MFYLTIAENGKISDWNQTSKGSRGDRFGLTFVLKQGHIGKKNFFSAHLFFELHFIDSWMKGGFRCVLKTTLILSQLMNLTLISINLEINLDFEKQLSTFWRQTWFQENLNFSQVNDIHSVSLMISDESVNIIILTILLNDSLVMPSIRVLIFCVKIFNECCIFSQRSCGVPWFVLLSKECLCKWEEYDSFINNSHFQAQGWWCWAEHLRGWRYDI